MSCLFMFCLSVIGADHEQEGIRPRAEVQTISQLSRTLHGNRAKVIKQSAAISIGHTEVRENTSSRLLRKEVANLIWAVLTGLQCLETMSKSTRPCMSRCRICKTRLSIGSVNTATKTHALNSSGCLNNSATLVTRRPRTLAKLADPGAAGPSTVCLASRSWLQASKPA